MGDAFVSALVKELASRLTSEAIKEFGLLWGFQDDVLALKDDFDMILAVLQDAEEKRSKAEAVKLWLQRLRSASLEVENLLDEISTEALLQRLHKQIGMKHRVSAFFSSNHNPFMFRVRTAHKVKAVRRKLDAIASNRSGLGLTPAALSDIDVDVADEMPNRETNSLIHDSSIIFGREKELEMVTEAICNEDVGKCDNGEVPVYSIWGMGGLGKTTLAQLVYNHRRVKQCFDLECWIYVSVNFQVKEIITKIIESIDDRGCTLTLLDKLQESLQNKLRGKKFLIVLDDVWIEEGEKAKWEELIKTLSYGAEGSIVVMTTRSEVTTRMCSKIPELRHRLGCLSEMDAWLLFKKLAFAPGREGDDISELESIGREIVWKCKGLPIEVKTLGSLMWSKSSTSDWLHVRDNNIWEVQENNVLPALKLSYDNLHPHAKRCFTYCCLFPKGYAMQKDVVIQLWASNYFIPPRGEKNVYLLGKNIFNYLVQRFFFEVVKDNKYLDDRYKMHDLMHDMAQHLMKDDCLVREPSDTEVRIPNGVLHLSSTCPDFLFSPHELKKLKSLRSIFMFGKMNEGNNINQLFNHKYVRVLYLCGIGLTTLPESIRNLIHLKYLNLSESRVEVLPESIVYLQNLQVLLLNSCRELYKLPDDLRYMCNLECLDISYCHSLSHLPLGIKQLSRLRILSKFPVGNEGGAKIEELGDLNLLEGKLKISGLENVGGLSEARSAKLECKENLLVLGLRWSDIYKRESKPEMFADDEEVLKGLEPNPCLKELNVFCYMGKIIPPSWMAKLQNLVEIRFYSCRRCDHIPQLGRLPKLRVIRLWSMESLKGFHGDDTKMLEDTDMFLSLRELRIYLCPNLVSLPSNLPNLEVLRLVKCDKLRSLPDKIQSFKNMNNLVILGCKLLNKRFEKKNHEDWAKISHIPNIRTRSPRYKQDEDEDESSW